MVGAAGLEPATLCLEGRCSIHLSYAPVLVSLYWGEKTRQLGTRILLKHECLGTKLAMNRFCRGDAPILRFFEDGEPAEVRIGE